MTDHRTILRRAGAAVVVVGMFGIGCNVYSLAAQTKDSFSLGIMGLFAIVAGVLVFNGGLRTALWVSRIIACLLACLVVVVVANVSLSLIFSNGKLSPIGELAELLPFAFMIALFAWVYLQLTSRPVRDAVAEAGINCTTLWRKSALGVYLGCVVAILLLVWR